MANMILAQMTASISELKRDPMGTVAAGGGFPVAILNRNAPAFYCVPVDAYKALIDKLDHLELKEQAIARAGKPAQKFYKDGQAPAISPKPDL